MIRRAIKRAPKKGKFAVGEHIRVVPFAPTDCPAPPQADLNLPCGALFRMEVFTIFLGKLWGSSPFD